MKLVSERGEPGVRTYHPGATRKALLGQCIRRSRERRGMTQTDLAQAINACPRSIQRYESGKDLSAERLAQIAAALGVAVQDLLFVDATDLHDSLGLPCAAGARRAHDPRYDERRDLRYCYRVVVVLLRAVDRLSDDFLRAIHRGVSEEILRRLEAPAAEERGR